MSTSVFDKLVSSLSTTERRDMLERIAGAVDLSPADVANDEPVAIDLEARYRSMGLVRRLIIVLVALFTGRERLSVVESYLLRDLARSVASRLPHGYDTVEQLLKPGALDDFRELAAAARLLGGPIGRVMGSERRSFISFLASLHAPETQARLLDETDPFTVGRQEPDLREADVRRRVLKACEDALSVVSPTIRSRIYDDVRGLHNLMALGSFPFDRMCVVFMPVADGQPVAAPLARLVDDLSRLANIYAGLRQGVSPRLFEALVLYQNRDALDDDDDRLEQRVRDDVQRLSGAYGRIGAFARHYPLADLVRLAHGNIHYQPTAQSGGEDWFAQWKGFWKERIEAAHRRFAYDRRVEAILNEARETLDLTSVDPFPGYPPSGADGVARHGLSLGLLHGFIGQVYRTRLASVVGVLYKEGEFYKSENRSDLDRLHHDLERLLTELANLEVRLRPTGDLGMTWKQALDESIPPEAAAERRESFVTVLDNDANALVHRFVEVFRTLGDVLQGVLYGTLGGRYDTIGNLADLGGSRSGAYVRKLEDVHVKIKAAASTVADLITVETMAAQTRDASTSYERAP